MLLGQTILGGGLAGLNMSNTWESCLAQELKAQQQDILVVEAMQNVTFDYNQTLLFSYITEYNACVYSPRSWAQMYRCFNSIDSTRCVFFPLCMKSVKQRWVKN